MNSNRLQIKTENDRQILKVKVVRNAQGWQLLSRPVDQAGHGFAALCSSEIRYRGRSVPLESPLSWTLEGMGLFVARLSGILKLC